MSCSESVKKKKGPDGVYGLPASVSPSEWVCGVSPDKEGPMREGQTDTGWAEPGWGRVIGEGDLKMDGSSQHLQLCCVKEDLGPALSEGRLFILDH